MPNYAYTLDPHQNNSANIIPAETQVLAPSTNATYQKDRVVFPAFAPFYEQGLEVRLNGQLLTFGTDYFLSHKYLTASERCAKNIYAGIWFINLSLKGTLSIKYHTLGGSYTTDTATIAAHRSIMGDPSEECWENVLGEDPYFPAVDIQSDRDAFIDEGHIVTALNELASTIRNKDVAQGDLYQMLESYLATLEGIVAGSTILTHKGDKANPHDDLWHESNALKVDGIAANATKAFGRTLAALTTYINSIGITKATLDQYVLRDTNSVLTGDMVLTDDFFTIETKPDSPNVLSRIQFQKNNVKFESATNVIIQADEKKNAAGESAALAAGNTELKVVSSGAVTDLNGLLLNGKVVLHRGNMSDLLPEGGAFLLDIVTQSTNTMTIAGKGTQSNPLKADLVIEQATPSVPGIAMGSVTYSQPDDSKVAFSQATSELNSKINAKLPTSKTINGLDLSKDIVLTASNVGLSNAPKVSDADYGVSAKQRLLLTNYALKSHTHSFAEMLFVPATTSIYGITTLTDNIGSGSETTGVSAAAVSEMYYTAQGLETQLRESLPSDVIDLTQYGGNNYLPIPAQGAYGAAGDNRASLSLAGLVESNDQLVILRNGQDDFEKGIFYWYATVLSDGTLTNEVSTSTKYQPTYLKTKGYNVDLEVCAIGSEDVFACRATNNDWHVILTSKTMDMTKHIGAKITGFRYNYTMRMFKVGEEILIIYPILNNDRFHVQAWKFSVDDIINLQEVTPVPLFLSGEDAFNTQLTDVTAFNFVPQGIGTDADPNHLMCRQDNSYWSTINLCHGPYRNYDALLDDTGVLHVIVTSSMYLANSVTSKWQNVWQVSFSLDTHTGEVVLNEKRFPVYLREGGFSFDNGALSGGTTLLEANNTGGVIRSRGHSFSFSYTNTIRAAYLRWFAKNDGTEFTADDMTRDAYQNVGNVKPVSIIKGSYGSVIEPNMRSIVLLPDNWFVASNERGGPWVAARYDPDSTYPGVEGFGPTNDRYAITQQEWLNLKRIPRWVDKDGNESRKGFVFSSGVYNGVYPRESEGVGVNDKRVTLGSGVWADMIAQMRAISGAVADSPQRLYEVCNAGFYGDLDYPDTVKCVVSYEMMYANDVSDLAGSRTILTQLFKFTFTSTASDGGKLVTINSITVLPTTLYRGTAGGYRSISISSENYGCSGRFDLEDYTLFTFATPSNRATTGSSGHFWRLWNSKADDSWTWQNYAIENHSTYLGHDYIPGKGHVRFNYGAAAESVKMEIYADGPSGAFQTTEFFSATKTAEGWNVYFTEEVPFFVNGKQYRLPVTDIDLKEVFPNDYQNNTFYVYAFLDVDGIAKYKISLLRTADNNGEIFIGSVTTASTQIESISIERVTRLGEFREMDEHKVSETAHLQAKSLLNKESVGLGLLSNADIKHTLVIPTFKEVFDSWYRFSHNASDNYPASAAETLTWTYDPNTDSIKNTTNSGTYIGIVSNEAVGDYTCQIVVNSTSGDDDWIGVVFAFVKDENGDEHTLSALACGDATHAEDFSVGYNYSRKNAKRYFTGNSSSRPKVNWNNIPERTITIIRTGTVFDISISKYRDEDGTDYHYVLDTALHPELSVFKGAVRFGYSSLSQPGSTWRNIIRPDEGASGYYASKKLLKEYCTWNNKILSLTGKVVGSANAKVVVQLPTKFRGLPMVSWTSDNVTYDTVNSIDSVGIAISADGNQLEFTFPANYTEATLSYTALFMNDTRLTI